jgi:hypothetical protein
MEIKSILSEGSLGNIGLKQLKEDRELVLSRWDETGLLEGLKGAVKENVAQLFENQASWMINESTTSVSSGSYETVAFPVIRRVFSKLLANEIVSVQALNMPIGRIYFMNPKISLREADGSHYTPDGAYSNAARMDATARTQFSTTSLYDSFYASESDTESGLWDRTKGQVTVVTVPVQIVTSWVNGTSPKLMAYITGFSQTNRNKLVGPAGIVADTEEFLAGLKVTANTTFANVTSNLDTIPAGTALIFRTLAQKYARPLVDSTGRLGIEIDLSASDNVGAYTVAYSALSATSAVTFNAQYTSYSNLEEDSEMAEISFDFDYITVDVGGARMMRAQFTPQIQQDISAFHSIDVEAELTSLLSETVALEIDREILRDIRKGAAWVKKWDYAGFTKRITNGTYVGTRKDYNQELVTIINQISAMINKTTLRGGANWLVVSSEISAIFNDLEYFHVTDASPEETKYSLGIEKIGSLGSRFQVYVDPYAPPSTLILGHKGNSIFESGYIFAPYVPLMMFPKQMNPFDFKTILGVMARYATKMINNRFYGKVIVENIATVGTIGEFL